MKRELPDFHVVVYNIIRQYNIEFSELTSLSKNDIIELMEKFPYTMALVTKYKDSSVIFSNKLRQVRCYDCYGCGIEFFGTDIRYQIINHEINVLEWICENCHEKRKYKKLLAKIL